MKMNYTFNNKTDYELFLEMVLSPCFGSLIFKPFLFIVESLNFSSISGFGEDLAVKREDRTTMTD